MNVQSKAPCCATKGPPLETHPNGRSFCLTSFQVVVNNYSQLKSTEHNGGSGVTLRNVDLSRRRVCKEGSDASDTGVPLSKPNLDVWFGYRFRLIRKHIVINHLKTGFLLNNI
jgi:hypothetical protein